LLDRFDEEFTNTFGGCSILRGLDGSYLSRLGLIMRDRINLIYTDTSFPLGVNVERVGRYADRLRNAAFDALQEEAILIVAFQVYHAE